MQVILKATDGPGAGVLVIACSGQVVTVGRTAWADFSVPADEEMSDVHFELDFGGQACRLRTQGTAVTTVNGEPATEVTLRSGDEVTAGQTTFTVQLPAELSSLPDQESADDLDTEASELGKTTAPPDKPPTAAEYSEPIKLGEDAKALLVDAPAPEAFFESLVADQLFSDALLFLACWVPRPDAVRWGCDCLEELLGDSQTSMESEALKAALSWAEDPSEKNCRAAEAVAQRNDYEGPACWLALAAFWSGESLAPPDLPKVPPGKGLTAQAVSAALTMAATQGDPRAAKDRFVQFLDKGRTVAENVLSAADQA